MQSFNNDLFDNTFLLTDNQCFNSGFDLSDLDSPEPQLQQQQSSEEIQQADLFLCNFSQQSQKQFELTSPQHSIEVEELSNFVENQSYTQEEQQNDVSPAHFSKQEAKKKSKKIKQETPIEYKLILEFILNQFQYQIGDLSQQGFRDLLGVLEIYVPNPQQFGIKVGQTLQINKFTELFTKLQKNDCKNCNTMQSENLNDFLKRYCQDKEKVEYTELSQKLDAQRIKYSRRTIYRIVKEKLNKVIYKERKQNQKISKDIKQQKQFEQQQVLKVIDIDNNGLCYIKMTNNNL